jgi:hypothetical protein
MKIKVTQYLYNAIAGLVILGHYVYSELQVKSSHLYYLSVPILIFLYHMHANRKTNEKYNYQMFMHYLNHHISII